MDFKIRFCDCFGSTCNFVFGSIIFTVIDYKRYSGGFITFKQVLKISLIITLLGSIAGAAYIDYVLHTIRYDELKISYQQTNEAMLQIGFEKSVIEKNLKFIEKNSYVFMFFSITFFMFINIILLTPMIGIMLRKSPTNPNNGDYPNF